MSDINKLDKLDKLDNIKLIEAVKNYKQYGYTEELREKALALLEERGISKEELQLTGNFENRNYKDAELAYKSFILSSKLAFYFYCLLIVFDVSTRVFELNSNVLTLILVISIWSSFIMYWLFLIKSFIDHKTFYKNLNKELGTGAIILFFVLGAPFYILMYFLLKRDMKEKMKLIT